MHSIRLEWALPPTDTLTGVALCSVGFRGGFARCATRRGNTLHLSQDQSWDSRPGHGSHFRLWGGDFAAGHTRARIAQEEFLLADVGRMVVARSWAVLGVGMGIALLRKRR